MFKITGGKGFHMTFANGYTVSVQFGVGNYCENRSKWDFGSMDVRSQDEKAASEGSIDAEVACWDRNGNWVNLSEFDQVVGWKTADEVALFLAGVSQLPEPVEGEIVDVRPLLVSGD